LLPKPEGYVARPPRDDKRSGGRDSRTRDSRGRDDRRDDRKPREPRAPRDSSEPKKED
jgi:polyribonucleotide nucleotidyltransferase